MSERPVRILFLCTGNSCRSQMAEGLARSLGRGRVEAFSAGTRPTSVHPLAVKAMQEAGIDIVAQRSKHVDTLANQSFDWVITVCDSAREACPVLPGKTPVHWSLDDPAVAAGSEEERLRVFRRIRDELRQRISLFLLSNKVI